MCLLTGSHFTRFLRNLIPETVMQRDWTCNCDNRSSSRNSRWLFHRPINPRRTALPSNLTRGYICTCRERIRSRWTCAVQGGQCAARPPTSSLSCTPTGALRSLTPRLTASRDRSDSLSHATSRSWGARARISRSPHRRNTRPPVARARALLRQWCARNCCRCVYVKRARAASCSAQPTPRWPSSVRCVGATSCNASQSAPPRQWRTRPSLFSLPGLPPLRRAMRLPSPQLDYMASPVPLLASPRDTLTRSASSCNNFSMICSSNSVRVFLLQLTLCCTILLSDFFHHLLISLYSLCRRVGPLTWKHFHKLSITKTAF